MEAGQRTPNRDQLAVIDELDRNIILFANAGTGKTFTVARRVEKVIATKRAAPPGDPLPYFYDQGSE